MAVSPAFVGPSRTSPRPDLRVIPAGGRLRSTAAALIVLLLAASPVRAERRHLAPGLAREGDTVVIESSAGDVQLDTAGGWDPVPEAAADVVVLARKRGEQRETRVVDRQGRRLAEYTAPPGWIPAGTEAGIILFPEALHEPVTAHRLRFLSHGGDLRREVDEPQLRLHTSRLMPGGRLVTVSAAGDGGTAWTVRAYGPDGAELWRHDTVGRLMPEALLAANGRRLVVLERDLDAGTSRITILRESRRAKSYRLPLVGQMVAAGDARLVAAVGEGVVALLDSETRKLAWRRDEPVDVPLGGGVRFDRRVPQLFVVSAEEDGATRKARLRLRTYRLRDGAVERDELGGVAAGELARIVDVETAPGAGVRVLLPDRAIETTPQGSGR